MDWERNKRAFCPQALADILNWLHILKEARMCIPALAILMIATVLTAAPARAETYDAAYPANNVWADRCDRATSDE
jgi:hypothetical protein